MRERAVSLRSRGLGVSLWVVARESGWLEEVGGRACVGVGVGVLVQWLEMEEEGEEEEVVEVRRRPGAWMASKRLSWVRAAAMGLGFVCGGSGLDGSERDGLWSAGGLGASISSFVSFSIVLSRLFIGFR